MWSFYDKVRRDSQNYAWFSFQILITGVFHLQYYFIVIWNCSNSKLNRTNHFRMANLLLFVAKDKNMKQFLIHWHLNIFCCLAKYVKLNTAKITKHMSPSASLFRPFEDTHVSHIDPDMFSYIIIHALCSFVSNAYVQHFSW